MAVLPFFVNLIEGELDMSSEQKPNLYHNRELSWLKFNQRVLEQAGDASIPLLERMKFISIFCSNLDEFFMIRVGTLTDASLVRPDAIDNKSLMTPAQQLEAIFEETYRLVRMKDETYRRLLFDLSQRGIEHLNPETLTEEQSAYLQSYFQNEVLPMLSPQIIDKHHPFPFLQNKEIYICAQLKTKGEFVKLAIIPTSIGFDRLVFLPFEKNKFILLEELVHKYCQTIFESYVVEAKTIFRITRNADINVDEALYDHDMDYRSVMEELVKSRRKLMPVRIEFEGAAEHTIVDQLCKRLELGHERVFFSSTPLDLSYGFSLCSRFERQGVAELFNPPFTPQDSCMLRADQPIFPQIIDHDVLLSYPFESMKPFIALLREAAVDESVLSIKMTLYRVARESQIVSELIKAAENGKEVYAVVELRARFDEENNIIWSKRLEEAGVNVIYGLGEYKVHSKLLVITRKINNKISFITQIGTGNYNESTAKLYTDLSLITANREIGEDGLRIFNGILTSSPVEHTKHLLAAPVTIKPEVLRLIDGEIEVAQRGEPAEILLKINSLTDKEIIDRLIAASKAGVRIRMVVRGICCLRAGVPGETDNIEVISIVGRFLEHSRVYIFGTQERCRMYISSADFMTRNTERRVEVAAPIYAPEIQMRIRKIIQLEFSDNVKAKRLLEDGSYMRVQNDRPPTDSQIDLYKLAYVRAEQYLAQRQQVTHPSKAQPVQEPAARKRPSKQRSAASMAVRPTGKKTARKTSSTYVVHSKKPIREPGPLGRLENYIRDLFGVK